MPSIQIRPSPSNSESSPTPEAGVVLRVSIARRQFCNGTLLRTLKLFVRTIGIARARTTIGMTNLAYNLTRFVWHEGRSVSA